MKKIQLPKFTEKMKRRFLAGACGVLMIFISIMAYFTSTEQVTNRFTVGEVKIDLVEPNWVGDADTSLENNHRVVNGTKVSYRDANYILPGELVPKDPKIVNTGKNEAIVFMKVEVPTYTDVLGEEHEVFVVTSANVTEGQNNSDVTPYYEFSKLKVGDSLEEPADNWCYMGKANGNDHTYIFGYCEILNPENSANNIIDNDNFTTANEQNEPTPFQTQNLFKYVMLNPELNGIDSYEGDKFYNTNGTPVAQEIKVYAYGVQSQFLTNNGNAITPAATGFTQTQLTTIWTTAGFGELENDKIPDADNHNKYGIPEDNPSNGNAWTSGEGTPIVNGKRNVLTRQITYHNGKNVADNNYVVTYKKIQGDTEWTGWYPTCNENTTWCVGDGTNGYFNSLQQLQSYINNSSGDLTINLNDGDFPAEPTAEQKNPTVQTLTVLFKENQGADAATVATAEFTRIGTTGNFTLTSWNDTFPENKPNDTELGWTDSSSNESIDNYDELTTYINNLTPTFTNNKATESVYKVTATP